MLVAVPSIWMPWIRPNIGQGNVTRLSDGVLITTRPLVPLRFPIRLAIDSRTGMLRKFVYPWEQCSSSGKRHCLRTKF